MSPAPFGVKFLEQRGCKGHLEGGGGTKASPCLAGGWNGLVQVPFPRAEGNGQSRGWRNCCPKPLEANLFVFPLPTGMQGCHLQLQMSPLSHGSSLGTKLGQHQGFKGS